jgi:hypothetical protein
MPGFTIQYTCVIKTPIKTWFLKIYEIRLLANEYSGEISAGYPHFDGHGRQINPLRPQDWGTGEKQLKKGEKL